MTEERSLESRWPELMSRGRAVAVDALVRELGAIVRGFVLHITRQDDVADEVMSAAWEDVLQKCEAYDPARGSLRAWVYGIARIAALRELRRRSRQALPLDEQREHAPSEQRELTAPWVRTTIKRQVRELREHLSPEDRMLVSLRADDSLSWAEVVDVLGISGDPKVVEARLRKRYQRIVEKLRKATLDP